MGIQIALNHRTKYRYERPVYLGPQVIQLRPAPHCRTPILNYALSVTPAQHILKWQLDPHSNYIARVLFQEKTPEFVVEVNLTAELVPFNPFDFFLEPGIEEFPFSYAPELKADLKPFLAQQPAGPRMQAFLNEFADVRSGTVSFLADLNRRVRDQVGYTKRMEHGVQTCEETLERGTGSCRDSAWLLVQVLRHIGIAARFVSGYLIQLAGEADGPAADNADLHAWTEAYLPGAGWIGLDSTSGLFAGEGHIPLVCTPSASAAAPIGGTVERAGVEFSHGMTLRRLNEAVSVSQPLCAADWAEVQRVAHQVDADLAASDVRLTMGGEPTFVGLDEPESPQWNIDAAGPIKRRCGLALIQALRDRTAPGAMLLYGQGKWYPGEALPRWALSCYWRSDGVPIWEKPELVAREDAASGYGVADARRFAEALAQRLQVGGENLLAGFNPGDGATEPVGYVLPLRRRQPEGKLSWSSQLWFARPERLTLLGGDSPIGFRIPVEAMPWVAPDEVTYERDEQDRVKLPLRAARLRSSFRKEPPVDPLPALSSTAATATELIRPALCVEARNGRMHVFLPYAAELADYLDVVAAVEDTCEYLQMPVWLEGYGPPSDTRLKSFSVTPDPGVLEINLPPAKTWDELVSTHETLFAEATANRLTAEKFNYDGGHVATGGGSHIVIGGETVDESPLLRRPDLLRSMVAFWQNHPSTSYLFSGTYVGPTSQYPRVDEARMDGLYELEVAFRNLPVGDCAPWIVDGLFRNLLVDVTGNSHRAEFCLDKLYMPEGRGLRLGLLELRAFEMTPHVRMGLVTLLLIRALVAMFWKRPYEGGLIRWGTALHDRFMLPHFVRQDFAEVLGELQRAGYPIEERWFGAQFEFRFPLVGSLATEGITLELRQALEPWNVLAEETNSGGTVRTVDSSLERVQVKVTGFADSRYEVSCNGRRIPLTATGTAGEMVAGVRYRARRYSESLHPTVPVHVPLIFDIIDRRTQRSVGRCVYHALRPDGEMYTQRPANAAEAEQRRRERFQVIDAGNDPMLPAEEEENASFPMTLDMRLPAIVRTASQERNTAR